VGPKTFQDFMRAFEHLAVADDAEGRLQVRHLHEFHQAAIDAVIDEDVIAVAAHQLDARQQRHAGGDEAAARLAFQLRASLPAPKVRVVAFAMVWKKISSSGPPLKAGDSPPGSRRRH
jgi:hypothetical protein